MKDVIRHYDLLIDEGTDFVHDPKPLQEYMELWDGTAFFQALALDGTQSVLEIGVGTGRLAMRTVPKCRSFTGVDVSPKTIARAAVNLSGFTNIRLICSDFLSAEFAMCFDVIYSSLTFMHIASKAEAVAKIAALLAPGGRVVLSLDKNRETVLDYGARKLTIYPDDPQCIAAYMRDTGLQVQPGFETEFAHVVIAEKI